MAKKIRTRTQKKELSNKIAEIIWVVLASVIFIGGIVFGLMGLIIEFMTGNLKRNPLYFLIEAQDKFFTWIRKWWTAFPKELSQFSATGLVLMGIGLVFLLLVLLVFSNRKEAIIRKEKAKKLRENNVKRFEEQLESANAQTVKEN